MFVTEIVREGRLLLQDKASKGLFAMREKSTSTSTRYLTHCFPNNGVTNNGSVGESSGEIEFATLPSTRTRRCLVMWERETSGICSRTAATRYSSLMTSCHNNSNVKPRVRSGDTRDRTLRTNTSSSLSGPLLSRVTKVGSVGE